MAKYEQHDFVKEIFWVANGTRHEGFAYYDVEEGLVSLANENWQVFDNIEQDDIENGATLEEIFEDIPEDVTDFNLK